MFRIVEPVSVMDSRKQFTCNKCGKKHIIFSYAIRECSVCKEKFPSIFLIIESKPYRINYYFIGTDEDKHKDIL